MMIRQKFRSAAMTVAAVLIALLLLATVGHMSAYAGEIAPGVTRISVPLTVPANDAVAGVEIEFSVSDGLAYVRFDPAPGLENKIDTKVGDKYYAGCFSSDNRYAPIGGKLTFGNLIFTYTGDAPQQILFSEIRLHTHVSAGNVSTVASNPNTVVKVTRKTPANTSNPADTPSGGGTSGGADGNNTSPGTGGAETDGGVKTTARTVSLTSGNPTEQTVVELDAAEIVDTETPLANGAETAVKDGNVDISASGVPLENAAIEDDMAETGVSPGVIAAIAVAIALAILLIARRRKREKA